MDTSFRGRCSPQYAVLSAFCISVRYSETPLHAFQQASSTEGDRNISADKQIKMPLLAAAIAPLRVAVPNQMLCA